MPSKPRPPTAAERDGTSQSDRTLPALDPGYVAVDERGLRELLAFARGYGRELRYFNAQNQPDGDWGDFIPESLDLDQVLAFAQDPSQFSPATSPELFRPHFVLFLVFLKLLDRSRQGMNALTARHLHYYYREYLRILRKPSIPDRVNLIIELARGARSVRLPAGTLLQAGPDRSGVDRTYATDRDLVVHRAQIAALRSLCIDCQRTTLRQAPRRHSNDRERSCELMFRIALGDPLPDFPGGKRVDYPQLLALRNELRTAEAECFLPIPVLRDLRSRLALRPPPPAEWVEINAAIEIAGRAKRAGGEFSLDRSSQDFLGNLQSAVGTIDLSTLPEIDRVDDLYDQRSRSDVQRYIAEVLYFRSLPDFLRMMQLKRRFDSEWAEINRILETAGQKQRGSSTYQLAAVRADAFADNLQAALGLSLAALDDYAHRVQQIEDYFCMPAELFALAVEEVRDRPIEEWEQVYLILEGASRERLRRSRRAALDTLRAQTPPARLIDLIRYALGEPASQSEDASALDRLVPFLGQSNTDKLTPLASEGSWDRVISLLELAWRSRQGEPEAEQTEWINLYPAADATQVQRDPESEEAASTPRFPAFGVARPQREAEPAPAAVIGWAVSSPLLFLREGARTITLTLGFAESDLPLSALFSREGELAVQCELSTHAGFVPCALGMPRYDAYSVLTGAAQPRDHQALQLVIHLDETADPVVPLPAAFGGVDSPYPTLRLMLRPIFSPTAGQHRASYPELSRLRLLAAQIRVEVSGLRSVQVQNDDSVLDAKKPFEPFGSQPAVGSRLLLGHRELVAKDLDWLRVDLKWMGAPENVSSHYAAYSLGAAAEFTARLCMIDRSRETTLLPAAPLFGATGSAPVTITAGPTPRVNPRQAAAQLSSDDAPDEDLLSWDRFLALELNAPDFQHANYPVVASSKALALAAATAQGTSINPADYLVRPPYTPKLKSLSLGYRTSLELRFDSARSDGDIHRVLHIHPFGFCDVEAERSSDPGLPFLPPYVNDGELYLGLRDLEPPQTLSIFFQVLEGSADPDLPQQPVCWSYLSGDRWLPLDRHILLDSTRSLRNSGMVELALPVASPSTRLREPLYWIRATLSRDTRAVCDIVGVHTQAVSATFVDRGNSPEHFREPLPAGSITQLAKAMREVAAVRQPYTSYGGRMAEDDTAWAVRTSERLRHKGRAVTTWDYERLALQRFPELHKVKCIPAPPDQPGRVRVVVIPDVRNKLPFEPFAPKAPANLLSEVREYLQERAASSVRLDVLNAHYVAVRVRLGVRFRSDGNEAFYKDQLNEALNRFLSPWAYDEGSDIAIGGRIYASRIVDFVDRLPYVEYVAGIKLFRSDDGVAFRPVPRPADSTGEGYAVSTERPDAVLVAARRHQIDVLSDATYAENLVTGIDFMKLEFDFIVSEG